jgi:Tol biopolymer transport system component
VQTALDPYTYDLGPGPSPDRISYAVSHGLGLGSELWTAGLSGQSPRLLLSDPDNIIAFARSSPAGDKIAFIKIPDSQVPYSIGELWQMDSSGAGAHKLADVDAGRGYAAVWSPDGKRLAFVLRSNPDDPRADQSIDALVGNLGVIDIRSGILTQVTHFEHGRPGTPAWSPAGNTLIFGYVLDGRMDVQVADPFGGQSPSLILKSACCPVFMRK